MILVTTYVIENRGPADSSWSAVEVYDFNDETLARTRFWSLVKANKSQPPHTVRYRLAKCRDTHDVRNSTQKREVVRILAEQ